MPEPSGQACARSLDAPGEGTATANCRLASPAALAPPCRGGPSPSELRLRALAGPRAPGPLGTAPGSQAATPPPLSCMHRRTALGPPLRPPVATRLQRPPWSSAGLPRGPEGLRGPWARPGRTRSCSEGKGPTAQGPRAPGSSQRLPLVPPRHGGHQGAEPGLPVPGPPGARARCLVPLPLSAGARARDPPRRAWRGLESLGVPRPRSPTSLPGSVLPRRRPCRVRGTAKAFPLDGSIAPEMPTRHPPGPLPPPFAEEKKQRAVSNLAKARRLALLATLGLRAPASKAGAPSCRAPDSVGSS